MSGEPILRIDGLGKRFRLYQQSWHRLGAWVRLAGAPRHQDVWALRGITLSVQRGECVGIIGRNGSGKSTLLKILAGAMAASEGRFEARGRVLALLELGAGFNPGLTGRQNVVSSAELLGFPPGYARDKMDRICNFADLGEYFDRPLKTYSSGMSMRLAFATYMFLEPDILIVDEVLSVGDVFFQQKCFEAVRRMMAGGTTLLYVSHDMASVCNVCDRVLLLDHGEIRFLGDPDEAVAQYFGAATRTPADREGQPDDAVDAMGAPLESAFAVRARGESVLKPDRPGIGTGRLRIVAARVAGTDGISTLSVRSGDTLSFEILAEAHDNIAVANVGLEIYDRMNQLIFAISALNLGQPLPALRRGQELAASFRVRFDLHPGAYTFVLVTSDNTSAVDPNTGTYEDRHQRLGPITVTWPNVLLPFYGIAGLRTQLEISVSGPRSG